VDATTLAIAGFSFLLGSFALRRVWRERRSRLGYAVAAALCMMAGFTVTIAAYGGELGIPMALAIVSPIALAVVVLGYTVRARPDATSNSRAADAAATVAADTGRVLVAVLLPALAALAIAAATAVLLPLEAMTRVVVAAYLLPIVWAGGMAWAISASRMRAVVVTGVIATLAGAAVAVPRLLGGV
jgi:hypothetical protein